MEIEVNVTPRTWTKKGGKKVKGWVLRWKDPVTGKVKQKAAKSSRREDAFSEAGELKYRLNAGETVSRTRTDWNAFVEAFAAEELHLTSRKYKVNVWATVHRINDTMAPMTLQTVAGDGWAMRFRNELQKTELSQATIHKYFQHLKTMVKWAVRKGLVPREPVWPKMRRTGGSRRHMKGRPITTEEYERMLAKCETEELRHLLEGLWLSGLRLGEAMNLTWDPWGEGIRIEVQDNGDLLLLIDADDQKNGQVLTYPVVDEFADFLRKHKNDGRVFQPRYRRNSQDINTVSKWIKDIGRAANVKTDERAGKSIWAGAHDFRRAFGARWSLRVNPTLLQRLMRHADIATTMRYYVGQDAQRDLQAIREAVKRQEGSDRGTDK